MTLRSALAGEARNAAMRARSYAHDAIRGRDMTEFRFWIGQAIARWKDFQALRERTVQ